MHRLLLYQSLDIAPKQRQLKDRLDRPRPTANEHQHLQAAFQRIAGHGIQPHREAPPCSVSRGWITDPLRHCTPGFSHAETFRNQGLHG